MIPVVLASMVVAALISPAFITYEYASGRLPADRFGLPPDGRREGAVTTVRALVPGGPPVGSLRGLTEPSTGTSLYTERELGHLSDVRTVNRGVYLVTLLSGFGVMAGLTALFRRPESRVLGWRALRNGGLLTAGLALTCAILALTAFEQLFAAMHAAFFAPGTFVFNSSDALIRLFPERLFTDAAIILGGLLLVSGTLIAAAGWWFTRTSRQARLPKARPAS